MATRVLVSVDDGVQKTEAIQRMSTAHDRVRPQGPAENSANRSNAAERLVPSVLLMGFYGRGNFGDDLMCSSLAHYLREGDEYRVSVVSSDMDAYRDLALKGVPIIPRNLRTVISALSQTHILCQGGGTNFHDSYKGKYLLRHWLNLLKWTMLFWIARLKGVQVIILGAGVGPLRHPVSRLITRLAYAACTAIGVRDQASVEELRKISSKTPYELGFDLAALSLPSSAHSARPGDLPQRQRVLGISACSLTPFLGDSALNERYWHTMGDALACFAQANPVHIIFFSLFTGKSSESDDAVTDLIISRLPEGLEYLRHGYHGDVGACDSLFAQCDWFLGTKFHAALSAYLHECECAVVTYNRKMTDLADEICLPPERCVDADKIQPLEVWLSVLSSLSREEYLASMLDREEASRRAREAVEAVLDRVRDKQRSLKAADNGG